jgi:hypothetical protein
MEVQAIAHNLIFPGCCHAEEASIYVDLILKQNHLSLNVNRAWGSVFTDFPSDMH